MLALLLAAHAMAAAPPPVVNGETVSEPLAVGAFAALEGGTGAVFCSGTLITEQWVLTAGHCQVGAEEYEDFGLDIVFIVGDDATSPGGVLEYQDVGRMVLHPDYSEDPYLLNDVALMRLDQPITAATPIEPSGLSPADADWPEEDVLFVGWGITSDTATDAGIKRRAFMPIVGYDTDYLYAIDDDEDQNLCSGDSGGAALVEGADGTLELVGVNSFVFNPNSATPSCVGGGAGAARVDLHLDWIERVLASGDNGGGDQAAAGSADNTSGFYVDEDKGACAAIAAAPCGMLALWGLGLGALRRRAAPGEAPAPPSARAAQP